MKRFVIGVDTSNYTTSASAVLGDGTVIANVKKLLPVASGERGLRQSDAVFAHVRAMPEVLGELSGKIRAEADGLSLAAVGYSSAPREAQGSYMPCFLVGEAVAGAIAADRALPVYASSHQAGHIMAALYSAGATDLAGRQFAAFHVSGGTTEITMVTPDEERILSAVRIGGSRDLNAGQLIDRIGVAMGLDFPAGRALDSLALSYQGMTGALSVCTDGLECNLSGAENKARSIYEKTGDMAQTAAFVLGFVARTLYSLSGNLRERYPGIPIVYAGGVMSSVYIRQRLADFGGYHASAEFSSDNAAGCALLTLEKWKRASRGAEVNG